MRNARAGTADRSRRGGVALAVLLGALVSAPNSDAQPVTGDVRQVGFQTSGQMLHAVRAGKWYPILLELHANATGARDITVRCEQVDLDGDRVAFIEPHVVVTGGAGIKRVWCYAATLGRQIGDSIDVDLIDQDGALLDSISVPLFDVVPDDVQVILDVSTQKISGIANLGSKDFTSGYNWGNRRFYRNICVATLPAPDLPDRWIGLEGADIIVWDEPDPQKLSDAQLEALVRWVHNGGQLVIGLGPAWPAVQKSVLASIIPLGEGQIAETDSLQSFTGQYARGGDTKFESAIAVALAEPAEDAIVLMRDRLADRRPLDLLTMGYYGSGRVIACAARLRDLEQLRPERGFYRNLVDVTENTEAFNAAESKNVFMNPLHLYNPVVAPVEFQALASVRMLAAFAFVAAYILISTFGAWNWLKRHDLTRTSWTVFAGFALVASVLSLGAVGLSRGVVGEIRNMAFVDLEAGSAEARTFNYFGYKSNRRQRLELSLPGEESFLRPMNLGGTLVARYATPDGYDADPVHGRLSSVPLRATLKQFEGRWNGTIGGTIRGELTADRNSGMLRGASWLKNDLDVPIRGGYLLYIDPRLQGTNGVPPRIADYTRSFQLRYWDSVDVPPAVNVLVVPIPAIEAGEQVANLGAEMYGQYSQASATWTNNVRRDPKRQPMLPTLWFYQNSEWMPGIAQSLQTHEAALLASTRGLYLHNPARNRFDEVGTPISSLGLPECDVTHWLTRGQAVLLLVMDDPGPATLYVNGEPRPSEEGFSLCRVRIPIRYTGQPPARTMP